jgi:hypothetical protein
MKRILTALCVTLFACSTAAVAQTAVSSASKVGTMTVHTTILNSGGIQTRVKKAATGDIISEITVYAIGGGQFNFSISSSTIHATDGGIDGLTTSQVYDLIGAATVATANSMGYMHCTASTDAATVVSAESCVTRTGSGSSTQFTPMNYSDTSTRKYNDVCVSTGGVSIDLLSTYDPGCSGTIR